MTNTNTNSPNVGVEVFRYLRKLRDINKFEKVRDTANLFEDLYYVNKEDPHGERCMADKSVSEAVAAINRRYTEMCSELIDLRQEVMALHEADNFVTESAVLDMLETAWQSYKFVFVDHEFKE